MALDLFESISTATSASITDLKDLSSEFMSTMACCEEGQCCSGPLDDIVA